MEVFSALKIYDCYFINEPAFSYLTVESHLSLSSKTSLGLDNPILWNWIELIEFSRNVRMLHRVCERLILHVVTVEAGHPSSLACTAIGSAHTIAVAIFQVFLQKQTALRGRTLATNHDTESVRRTASISAGDAVCLSRLQLLLLPHRQQQM